jgi:ribosomal protein S9
MTRTRINIDIGPNLLGWLDTTATVVGATRTETARALLQMMSDTNPQYQAVKTLIEDHREQSNQSRRRSQNARRHPQQQ